MREVNREARVGEKIKIVKEGCTDGCYQNGDIFIAEEIHANMYGVYFKTNKTHSSCSREGKNGYSFAWNGEYVVIEEDFTLSDIKPCMVVKLRGNVWCIAIQEKSGIGFYTIHGLNGISDLKNYNDDFTSSVDKKFDIMEIRDYVSSIYKYQQSELLYKREEKSHLQIELEKLEIKQREIADEIARLRKNEK